MINWKDRMELKIPDGINVNIDGTVINVKGKLGATSRNFRDKYVKVYKKENSIPVFVR